MTEPTPEMIHAARAVVQTRHRVISTLDLVEIVAAALAVDPLRRADTVPVDRDLLREIDDHLQRGYVLGSKHFRELVERLLRDFRERSPDPDQP